MQRVVFLAAALLGLLATTSFAGVVVRYDDPTGDVPPGTLDVTTTVTRIQGSMVTIELHTVQVVTLPSSGLPNAFGGEVEIDLDGPASGNLSDVGQIGFPPDVPLMPDILLDFVTAPNGVFAIKTSSFDKQGHVSLLPDGHGLLLSFDLHDLPQDVVVTQFEWVFIAWWQTGDLDVSGDTTGPHSHVVKVPLDQGTVPEPGTLAMALGGFAFLTFLRHRR